jgi:hypothetical protein
MTAKEIGGAIVRGALFVAVTVALVGLYGYALARALPPLRTEPPALLLHPTMAIAGAVSLPLYRFVRHGSRLSTHALALYLAFAVAAVLYGGYLWAVIPHATIGMIPLTLVAVHLYGAPLFVGVLVAQRLLVQKTRA